MLWRHKGHRDSSSCLFCLIPLAVFSADSLLTAFYRTLQRGGVTTWNSAFTSVAVFPPPLPSYVLQTVFNPTCIWLEPACPSCVAGFDALGELLKPTMPTHTAPPLPPPQMAIHPGGKLLANDLDSSLANLVGSQCRHIMSRTQCKNKTKTRYGWWNFNKSLTDDLSGNYAG